MSHRGPGGPAAKHRALPQRDTGITHGDGRRRGIIKRRWTLRGQTPRPARLWRAHGDAPCKTLSVCYLPSRAGGAAARHEEEGAKPHGGASREARRPSIAPYCQAARGWSAGWDGEGANYAGVMAVGRDVPIAPPV